MKAFLKKNLRIIIGISVFVFMLIVDIISKRLVENSLTLVDAPLTIIPFLFNFKLAYNTESAFGIVSGRAALIVLVIVSILAAGVMGFALIKMGNKSKVLSIALGLVIAGALGNAIDRILYLAGVLRGVVDFIQFAFWKSFPVFNFADTSVICGLVTLLVYIIFIYKEPKKEVAKEVLKDDTNKSET